MSNLQNALDSLLVAKNHLKPFLKEAIPMTDTPGKVSTAQYFLKHQSGKPLTENLASLLGTQLVNYCIPRRKRAKAYAEGKANADAAPIELLRQEARRLFLEYSKTHTSRSGEAGELLAFCIVEQLLCAPLAVAKMHFKTSANMPVYGADGVHILYKESDDRLYVLFVESKLHQTLYSGADDAAKSIKSFVKERKDLNEIRLVLDFGNFDGLPAKAQEVLQNYLDPYRGLDISKREDRHVCVLAYDENAYKTANTDADIETKFVSNGNTRVDVVTNAINSQKHVPLEHILAVIVAVPSVQGLRDSFDRALSHG